MEQEVKTMARMPRDVRDWLRDYAMHNNRSMNGQLIAILKGIMEGQQMDSSAVHGFGGGRAQRRIEA